MRIGIGLPAAVPGADMTTLGQWAAESERAGFAAVGVIDRLVYANLDPLIALAVAAGRTERVDLATTVLSIGWRNNPILVAKQLASLDLVSGGRLLAGLGLGGWPEDYLASQVPQAGNAAGWESSLAAMRQVWDGKLRGQGGADSRAPRRAAGAAVRRAGPGGVSAGGRPWAGMGGPAVRAARPGRGRPARSGPRRGQQSSSKGAGAGCAAPPAGPVGRADRDQPRRHQESGGAGSHTSSRKDRSSTANGRRSPDPWVPVIRSPHATGAYS